MVISGGQDWSLVGISNGLGVLVPSVIWKFLKCCQRARNLYLEILVIISILQNIEEQYFYIYRNMTISE